MYGTVAYCRAKPGVEGQLLELLRAFEAVDIPGIVATYVYRMDADSNDCYMSVVFESKEAYLKNAESPEQDARYRRLVTLLESEPEWHDGEIIYIMKRAT